MTVLESLTTMEMNISQEHTKAKEMLTCLAGYYIANEATQIEVHTHETICITLYNCLDSSSQHSKLLGFLVAYCSEHSLEMKQGRTVVGRHFAVMTKMVRRRHQELWQFRFHPKGRMNQ